MFDSTKGDEIPDSGDHGEGRERRQNTKSEKGTELFMKCACRMKVNYVLLNRI